MPNRRSTKLFRVFTFIGGAGTALFMVGCHQSRVQPPNAESDPGPSPALPEPAPDGQRPIELPDAAPACTDLQCRQRACPAASTTSVTGTAYAPNGVLPLYNVTVFVPNGSLGPLPKDIACESCAKLISGKPLVIAQSDHEGKFRLSNVPVGNDIPLVVQIGKWRRRTVIPEVRPCVDNVLTDPELTRLPRNRQEGDLPRVAVTTGGCDQLGCLLPSLGVDFAEMGVAGDDKAVTFFHAPATTHVEASAPAVRFGPVGMTVATDLWEDVARLRSYDMVISSCLCEEATMARTARGIDAMTQYLNGGGRLFGTDFEYAWLRHSPDPRLASAIDISGGAPNAQSPITIDTSFPKAKALADWIGFLDPGNPYGQVSASVVFDNFRGAGPAAGVWAKSPGKAVAGIRPRVVTVNTPVGLPVEKQCGRVALLDVHISQNITGIFGAFPRSCSPRLNKAENVLAFFLFDLAACIQDEKAVPSVPVD